MIRARVDVEDLSVQQDMVANSRAHLADALNSLTAHARLAARAAGSKTGRPDLDAVRAAMLSVERAEQACDFAAYDLATAAGEDG